MHVTEECYCVERMKKFVMALNKALFYKLSQYICYLTQKLILNSGSEAYMYEVIT